jgi:AP-2 complex subunit sigma-1
LWPNPDFEDKMVLSFILIQNRQGKTRLAKWYAPYTDEEKVKLKGEVWFFTHALNPPSADLPYPQVHRLIAPRDQKYQSNFVEFRSAPSASGSVAIARQNLSSTKIVYRRYAGLFFCVCVDANDNELAYLEAIHFFVEVLDQFFGNVCELDLVFNFYKVCDAPSQSLSWSSVENDSNCLSLSQVYAILDEVFLAGEIEETSKQVVLTRLEHLDKLE